MIDSMTILWCKTEEMKGALGLRRRLKLEDLPVQKFLGNASARRGALKCS